MNQKTNKKSAPDSFLRLKYMAYRRANIPPEGFDFTYEDLVQHAKFQLCLKNRVLWKDPIWDRYQEEEILVEYYAHRFSQNEEEVKTFLDTLQGQAGSDFLKWADKQMTGSNPDPKPEEIIEPEDTFEFSPNVEE